MTAASTLSSSDDQTSGDQTVSGQSLAGNATTGDRNGANDKGTAPVESRGARATSFDLGEFAIPTGREEEWRFTPLDRLRGLHDSTAALDGKVLVAINAPDEVVVESVERGDARLGRAGEPGDRVAAQAWASHAQAVIVTVPAETVTTRATVLRHSGDGGPSVAAFGHVLVDVKPFAQATVVLEHTGSVTYADNVELRVGDGASLVVVSIADWDDDAVHVSQHNISLGRDARVKHVVVSFGGDVVRVSTNVAYDGPGGDAELLGLYFADAGQHLENRLFVDHAVPRCRSRVTYKGALQGESSHTVWVGDVLIRAAAEGTDTYELNRNLLLTEGARADSVPNLEIETGEIEGAGHASATGRFDDEQLFYLQSRGIDEDEARRLVVRGFFADLVQGIGVPELQERLTQRIESELSESLG